MQSGYGFHVADRPLPKGRRKVPRIVAVPDKWGYFTIHRRADSLAGNTERPNPDGYNVQQRGLLRALRATYMGSEIPSYWYDPYGEWRAPETDCTWYDQWCFIVPPCGLVEIERWCFAASVLDGPHDGVGQAMRVGTGAGELPVRLKTGKRIAAAQKERDKAHGWYNVCRQIFSGEKIHGAVNSPLDRMIPVEPSAWVYLQSPYAGAGFRLQYRSADWVKLCELAPEFPRVYCAVKARREFLYASIGAGQTIPTDTLAEVNRHNSILDDWISARLDRDTPAQAQWALATIEAERLINRLLTAWHNASPYDRAFLSPLIDKAIGAENGEPSDNPTDTTIAPRRAARLAQAALDALALRQANRKRPAPDADSNDDSLPDSPRGIRPNPVDPGINWESAWHLALKGRELIRRPESAWTDGQDELL